MSEVICMKCGKNHPDVFAAVNNGGWRAVNAQTSTGPDFRCATVLLCGGCKSEADNKIGETCTFIVTGDKYEVIRRKAFNAP